MMIRTGYSFVLTISIAFFWGCKKSSPLLIEPISRESNDTFLSGRNLDSRLYSTKMVFQYYQIEGYKDLPAKKVAAKLDSFVTVRYPLQENRHRNSLSIWFYRKRMFGTYEDLVYESARESENGSLIGRADDVVALVDMEFLPNGEKRVVRHTHIYKAEQNKPLHKTDTLEIQ